MEDGEYARQLKLLDGLIRMLYPDDSTNERSTMGDDEKCCVRLGTLVKVRIVNVEGKWVTFYFDPFGTEQLALEWSTWEEARAFGERHVARLSEYDITHSINYKG